MDITNTTTVLITGASTGIGEALAVELAHQGANIAICARRVTKLREVADKIQQAGGTPLVLAADVTDKEAATSIVQRTIETFGGIDVLVNNAGRGHLASVEDTTVEQIESMFSLNVYSLFYTTAAALPFMKQQRKGHIINIASVAGKMAFPFNSAYVAAKHAVVGFSAALRTELVETGVDVTVVCPDGVLTNWASVTEGGPIGDIFTRGIQRSRHIAKERSIPLAPLKPMMKPEDIAAIIVDIIRKPGNTDVFTHPGTYELAVEVAHDRHAVETKFLPLYLGMRDAYEERGNHG